MRNIFWLLYWRLTRKKRNETRIALKRCLLTLFTGCKWNFARHLEAHPSQRRQSCSMLMKTHTATHDDILNYVTQMHVQLCRYNTCGDTVAYFKILFQHLFVIFIYNTDLHCIYAHGLYLHNLFLLLFYLGKRIRTKIVLNLLLLLKNWQTKINENTKKIYSIRTFMIFFLQ